jgi:hypothetical protein
VKIAAVPGNRGHRQKAGEHQVTAVAFLEPAFVGCFPTACASEMAPGTAQNATEEIVDSMASEAAETSWRTMVHPSHRVERAMISGP